MKRFILLSLLLIGYQFSPAQIHGFDFVKGGDVDKSKAIGVRKERKDKYGYNTTIESSFLKAGYTVSGDYSAFYMVEYYVGPQPVSRGADDFTFRIKLSEASGGKLIATASVISHSKSDILANLQNYINEFVKRLA
jgi:hypothetical protein